MSELPSPAQPARKENTPPAQRAKKRTRLRPNSKIKNTPPGPNSKKKTRPRPKQQKKKHAPGPNSKKKKKNTTPAQTAKKKSPPHKQQKKEHATRPKQQKTNTPTRPNSKNKTRPEGAGAFFCFAVWAGACSFFLLFGRGLGPRPNSRKKKHAPDQTAKKNTRKAQTTKKTDNKKINTLTVGRVAGVYGLRLPGAPGFQGSARGQGGCQNTGTLPKYKGFASEGSKGEAKEDRVHRKYEP